VLLLRQRQKNGMRPSLLLLRILTHWLILKERLWDHTFFLLFQKATKSVLAYLHIFKEQQNV